MRKKLNLNFFEFKSIQKTEGCGIVLSSRDKELLKIMEESLRKYLKAASDISQEAFDVISEYNGLLWSEISTQVEIIEKICKTQVFEEEVEKRQDKEFETKDFVGLEPISNFEKPEPISNLERTEPTSNFERIEPIDNFERTGAINNFERTEAASNLERIETIDNFERTGTINNFERTKPVSNFEGTEPVSNFERIDPINSVPKYPEATQQENESKDKENNPFYIYDKVVSFMKMQKCDELQWVRTYTFKCNYEGIDDFQIKYFEHKDPIQQGKNYLMFGNTRQNYSIRKTRDDIVGDITECFEIILNLSELFNVRS